MGGPCSTNVEKRKAYRLFAGKPEGKRPLGRPRRWWVDNIRMNLGEVGWGDVDWIGLAQDRNKWRALVNSVLNLRVPWSAGKLSSGLASTCLSSSVQLHKISLISYLLFIFFDAEDGGYSSSETSMTFTSKIGNSIRMFLQSAANLCSYQNLRSFPLDQYLVTSWARLHTAEATHAIRTIKIVSYGTNLSQITMFL
jgi:hypothetical protein